MKMQQLLVWLHFIQGWQNKQQLEARGSELPCPQNTPASWKFISTKAWLEASFSHRTPFPWPCSLPFGLSPVARPPLIRRKQQPGVEDTRRSTVTETATKEWPLSFPGAWFDLDTEEEGGYHVSSTYHKPGALLSALKDIPIHIPADTVGESYFIDTSRNWDSEKQLTLLLCISHYTTRPCMAAERLFCLISQ